VEILIPKIEVGRGASFDFFASVKSSVMVQVQLPTSAEIQLLGGEAREKVNLILSLPGLAFFPKFWLVRLPKGTLKYVNFIAEVSHFHSSNETTVQMHVELKNTSSNLLKFQARLDGNVMGKTSPNRAISFDGIIGSDETKKFIYDRILNVPTNEKVGPTTPVLSGALEYDVTYWQENYPEDRRQTAKHVDFELWRPFNPTAPDDGSKIRQTQQTITVKFSNEIEE
jgi:hypothetical protein